MLNSGRVAPAGSLSFDANQGSEFAGAADLAASDGKAFSAFSIEQTDDFICIKTSAIICRVARTTSSVSFTDTAGKLIFETNNQIIWNI